MSACLGVATLEEFLDLFHVLWFVGPLATLLMLAAVVRLRKRLRGSLFLAAGLGVMVLSQVLEAGMRRGWIEMSYTPSYAVMVEEFELVDPEWSWWEPLLWWSAYLSGVGGMIAAAIGFICAGRGMARRALRRDWQAENPGKEQSHAG